TRRVLDHKVSIWKLSRKGPLGVAGVMSDVSVVGGTEEANGRKECDSGEDENSRQRRRERTPRQSSRARVQPRARVSGPGRNLWSAARQLSRSRGSSFAPLARSTSSASPYRAPSAGP